MTSTAPSAPPIPWRGPRNTTGDHEIVARYAQRMTELCGPADAAMLLRRVNALLEAGEDASRLATRLNAPARPPRTASSDPIRTLADALVEEPEPSKSDRALFGRTLDLAPRARRNDADLAFELRVQREVSRVGRGRNPLTGEAKAPTTPPPPKEPPAKPRPVKRPAPQRKGTSTRPGGVVLRVITDGHGTRWRVGACQECEQEFRHPMQRGRFPLKCEACR